jgi:hypothetical protein
MVCSRYCAAAQLRRDLSAHSDSGQCHNFKDPSVQLYGGSMFKVCRKTLVWLSVNCLLGHLQFGRCGILLLACTRYDSRQRTRGHVHVMLLPFIAFVSSPANCMFMNRYGGCFSPESPVKLFDGATCEIQFLMPGMRVWGGVCVVKILRLNYRAFIPMVSLDAATTSCGSSVYAQFGSKHTHIVTGTAATLVTPWHPVFIGGDWTFPCTVRSPSLVYMDSVFNVVLSSGHVLVINDLEFITLGHGIVSHPVLAHSFFGTQVGWCLLPAYCHATVTSRSGCLACAAAERHRQWCCHCQRSCQARAIA